MFRLAFVYSQGLSQSHNTFIIQVHIVLKTINLLTKFVIRIEQIYIIIQM